MTPRPHKPPAFNFAVLEMPFNDEAVVEDQDTGYGFHVTFHAEYFGAHRKTEINISATAIAFGAGYEWVEFNLPAAAADALVPVLREAWESREGA